MRTKHLISMHMIISLTSKVYHSLKPYRIYGIVYTNDLETFEGLKGSKCVL